MNLDEEALRKAAIIAAVVAFKESADYELLAKVVRAAIITYLDNASAPKRKHTTCTNAHCIKEFGVTEFLSGQEECTWCGKPTITVEDKSNASP